MKTFAVSVLLILLSAISSFPIAASTAATNTVSDAEAKGRELARQYLEQKPTADAEQTGILKIRDDKGKTTDVPFKCRILVTPTNWSSVYEAVVTNADGFTDGNYLKIVHSPGQPSEYTWNNINSPKISSLRSDLGEVKWTGTGFIHPFFQSDFWAVDLGAEFFHWPGQKIIKHEMRRGRACRVLESTNPQPSTNGYSRVVSWVDNETGGIVHAEAYDADNKLLKVFDPKEFKKVNGQWALQEMEIRNVQRGTRTRIEFDLPDSK